MKPFSLFLHWMKPEIVKIEFPHLAIIENEKKKLALYPGIIVKCKDIGVEKNKSRFQILLGQLTMIKNQ